MVSADASMGAVCASVFLTVLCFGLCFLLRIHSGSGGSLGLCFPQCLLNLTPWPYCVIAFLPSTHVLTSPLPSSQLRVGWGQLVSVDMGHTGQQAAGAGASCLVPCAASCRSWIASFLGSLGFHQESTLCIISIIMYFIWNYLEYV